MVEYHPEVLKKAGWFNDYKILQACPRSHSRDHSVIREKRSTEILPDEEYLKLVDAKLDEVLTEYHKDQNIEELMGLFRDAAIIRTSDLRLCRIRKPGK